MAMATYNNHYNPMRQQMSKSEMDAVDALTLAQSALRRHVGRLGATRVNDLCKPLGRLPSLATNAVKLAWIEQANAILAAEV